MRLSVIIPAYNEEQYIKQCLQSVFNAFDSHRNPEFSFEIIVVNNNSSDSTADLAQQSGAKVAFEPVNQISRARNTGAAVATGNWLLFVDADSLISSDMATDMLQLIADGKSVGCGSTMQMPNSTWWGNVILYLWTGMSILCRWASGALLLCRADAFHDVGGFNQDLYAADEIILSQNLKNWGKKHRLKFSILTKHPLSTSARKLYLYSGPEIASQFFSILLNPRRALMDKKKLPMWYSGRR